MLDIEAKAVEQAHVDVCHPDESEPGDEVSAPVVVEHLESGKDQEEGRDVVAEAVFAGEQVEELANKNWLAVLAFLLAEVARFAKDLFVGDGPGGARDRQSENHEVSELALERHHR